MVEKAVNNNRNVIDFLTFQRERKDLVMKVPALSVRCCRHCGAALYEDELEDDCSSAGVNVEAPASRDTVRKFYAD
jgi:hypothetical protein